MKWNFQQVIFDVLKQQIIWIMGIIIFSTLSFSFISLLGNYIGDMVTNSHSLWMTVSYVIGGWCFIGVSSWITHYGLSCIIPDIRKDYTQRLFKILQRSTFFTKPQQFQNYIENYVDALCNTVSIMVDDILPRLLFSGYVLWLFSKASWYMCLLSLLWAVIVLLLNIVMNQFGSNDSALYIDSNNKLQNYIQNVFLNWNVTKIYNLEDYNNYYVNRLQNTTSANEHTTLWNRAKLPLVIGLFTAGMQGIFIWILIHLVKNGLANAAFIMAMNGWFMFVIYFRLEVIIRMLNDINRINTLANIFTSIPEDTIKGNVRLDELHGHIRFKNPVITEPYALTNLSNLDFQLKPGESLLVVGETGSGKSTLAKVIARLINLKPDGIFIDGEDLTNIDPDWLRDHVSYMMQDDNYYDGSIKENILLGSPYSDYSNMVQTAMNTYIHEVIIKLKNNYNEHITCLSNGEQRRVGITRAMLDNSKKIVICDEILDSLDPGMAHKIIDSVFTFAKNKTLIFITHQFCAEIAAKTNYVLWLKKDEVMGFDTHTNLMNNPEYRNFIGVE